MNETQHNEWRPKTRKETQGGLGFQLKYVTLKFYVRFYCWIKLLLGILHISTWHKMLSHKILVTTQLILFPVLVNKLEIEFQKKVL